jgi:hypothetical protein
MWLRRAIRGAMENWYKVLLSDNDIINGEGLHLQTEFMKLYVMNPEARIPKVLSTSKGMATASASFLRPPNYQVSALSKPTYVVIAERAAPQTTLEHLLQKGRSSREPLSEFFNTHYVQQLDQYSGLVRFLGFSTPNQFPGGIQ